MKRIVDLFLILLSLPFLLIVVGLLASLVRFKLGSPIFFSQYRPGLNGCCFNLFKFRTMTNNRNNIGELLPDSQRVTKLGQLLRSLSLDELPGLWCVFTGKMSLVGPRPLLVEYLPLYSDRHAKRHEVKPGITGWAQVNGRNAISWEEKFDLDIWYLENQTLWLDIKILFLSFKKVVARDGINAQDHINMPLFKGYK
jgi:sugar transferase EpsL